MTADADNVFPWCRKCRPNIRLFRQGKGLYLPGDFGTEKWQRCGTFLRPKRLHLKTDKMYKSCPQKTATVKAHQKRKLLGKDATLLGGILSAQVNIQIAKTCFDAILLPVHPTYEQLDTFPPAAATQPE